ncbi:MAG TPA: hypothetical protein VFD92_15495 [Candidatus Binatia bacterium]|nr:hypothetical protein [Candidatus Binatia bacterium]
MRSRALRDATRPPPAGGPDALPAASAPRARPPRRRARSIRRRALVALALPALGVVALTIAALRLWSDELVDRLPIGRDAERFLVPLKDRQARVAAGGADAAGPAARPVVVLFGDSVIQSAAPRLEEALAARGAPAEVVPVTGALLRPIHDVFLLDEALAAEPELVAIEVNLVWLNPPRGIVPQAWRERLSRYLSAARMPRILDALAVEQASLADPFLFRLEDALGILYAPPGARLAAADAAAAASLAAERALGIARRRAAAEPSDVAWVGEAYARDFAATTNVSLLRELRRGLAEARVRALFFVAPVNEGELARRGMPVPEDLAQRIDRLRVAAGIPSDDWLDFHAAVRPEDFRDVLGHVVESGRVRLMDDLAAAAAPRLGPLSPGGASASGGEGRSAR